VNVRLNGSERVVAPGTTVAALVAELVAGETRGVAVALEGEVVPREAWAHTTVLEGQAVEVLRAVQGG
jgi:sulfur carrier protein